MIKYLCAVLIDRQNYVLVSHKKNSDDINQNWCLPFWEFDSSDQSTKDFLLKKLYDEFRIKEVSFLCEKEIEHTLFIVFKVKDATSVCVGESYDRVEFRPWEIARDYTDDSFYQIYYKLFAKIKKHLESLYSRYFRIFIKLVSALILFLLPFAVLWKFFK